MAGRGRGPNAFLPDMCHHISAFKTFLFALFMQISTRIHIPCQFYLHLHVSHIYFTSKYLFLAGDDCTTLAQSLTNHFWTKMVTITKLFRDAHSNLERLFILSFQTI